METMLAIEILMVPTIAMRAAKSQSVRNIFTTTFIRWLKFMTRHIDVCTNSMASDKTNHESVYLSRNHIRSHSFRRNNLACHSKEYRGAVGEIPQVIQTVQ
jgi:hypothetical protein